MKEFSSLNVHKYVRASQNTIIQAIETTLYEKSDITDLGLNSYYVFLLTVSMVGKPWEEFSLNSLPPSEV